MRVEQLPKARPFRVTISRVINAPLPFVYAWWTDFREDDPTITGQRRTISILNRSTNRFIMSVRYKSRGRDRTAARIISLEPPDSWHLDWIGDEHNETADYKLTRVGNWKTRARATFEVINRTPTTISRPGFLKNVDAVWDRFLAALESDYREERKRKLGRRSEKPLR
jgi:hypothetical protein